MDRFVKTALVFAIAAFFAVMWGLLLRLHLPSSAPPSYRPDYSRLLRPGEEERTTEWSVHIRGSRIGLCKMKVEREEGLILVTTDTRITVDPVMAKIFGMAGTLDVEFRASISPLRGLQSFQARSDSLNTLLHGVVSRGEILLTGNLGEDPVNARFPFREDQLLGGALSPMAALPALDEDRVGDSWSLNIVNPIVGAVQQVVVTVAGFKRVVLQGKETNAFRLRFATGANRWTTWVAEDGEVLVQGTPFGLALRRTDLPATLLAELDAGPLPPSADAGLP